MQIIDTIKARVEIFSWHTTVMIKGTPLVLSYNSTSKRDLRVGHSLPRTQVSHTHTFKYLSFYIIIFEKLVISRGLKFPPMLFCRNPPTVTPHDVGKARPRKRVIKKHVDLIYQNVSAKITVSSPYNSLMKLYYKNPVNLWSKI